MNTSPTIMVIVHGLAPRCEAASSTDIGTRRKVNQDRFLVRDDFGLYAVADGMGGHLGGEIAAQMCVDTIEEQICNKDLRGDTKMKLVQALQAANERVYEASISDPKLSGMGTTATCLSVTAHGAVIAQVGDSRAYFVSQSGIWQLTKDHSVVAEKLRAGLITREQVKTDSSRNVITRSVGIEPILRVETFEMQIRSGDFFLLCSDGVSGALDDPQILAILQPNPMNASSLQETLDRLVAEATRASGDDNATAVLVRIASETR
jgi:PPM family protein phosphatase